MAELSFQTRLSTQKKDNSRAGGLPPKVLVIGNWSGHASDIPLAKRKHHRITKDNLEDVFARLDVQLSLSAVGSEVSFEEIDDLTPDHLFRNIAVFREYKALKKQLMKPGSIDSTIARLKEAGIVLNEAPQTITEDSSEVSFASDIFESLLSTPAKAQAQAGFDVDAFIQPTVAPFIQEHDPRANNYIDALDQASSQLLRAILHQSAYQQLEASWLSLERFNRTVDTDWQCHLHILDTTLDELIANTQAPKIQETALFQSIATDRDIAGDSGYSAILLDIQSKNSEEQQALLSFWQQFSALSGIAVYTGVSIKAAKKLNAQATQPESSQSRLVVTTPSYMVRVPYGEKTRACEALSFEEIPASRASTSLEDYYLWGNSAYLLLTEQLAGSAALSGLPYDSYLDNDNETIVVPATQTYLNQKQVQALNEQGFCVAESVKNSDRVIFNATTYCDIAK